MAVPSEMHNRWKEMDFSERSGLLAITQHNLEQTIHEPERFPGWSNNLAQNYQDKDFDKLPEWLQKALAVVIEF